ncbi:MAG TPA: DUF72 domain-containing protein [Puia sp.]|nr:DUF72 domain-containing protein [Puia sp.]
MPPDDPETAALWPVISSRMPDGGSKGPLRVYVGGTEWGRSSWVGKMYPVGTKSADYLKMYARQLDTVELNTLFYGLQPPAVLQRWADAVGSGFRFCPKFPETISHKGQLSGVGKDTDEFIERVGLLGSRLGPSFLQSSERFGPERAVVLRDYVRRMPPGFRVAVELRHEGWFGGGSAALGEVWQLLCSGGRLGRAHSGMGSKGAA